MKQWYVATLLFVGTYLLISLLRMAFTSGHNIPMSIEVNEEKGQGQRSAPKSPTRSALPDTNSNRVYNGGRGSEPNGSPAKSNSAGSIYGGANNKFERPTDTGADAVAGPCVTDGAECSSRLGAGVCRLNVQQGILVCVPPVDCEGKSDGDPCKLPPTRPQQQQGQQNNQRFGSDNQRADAPALPASGICKQNPDTARWYCLPPHQVRANGNGGPGSGGRGSSGFMGSSQQGGPFGRQNGNAGNNGNNGNGMGGMGMGMGMGMGSMGVGMGMGMGMGPGASNAGGGSNGGQAGNMGSMFNMDSSNNNRGNMANMNGGIGRGNAAGGGNGGASANSGTGTGMGGGLSVSGNNEDSSLHLPSGFAAKFGLRGGPRGANGNGPNNGQQQQNRGGMGRGGGGNFQRQNR